MNETISTIDPVDALCDEVSDRLRAQSRQVLSIFGGRLREAILQAFGVEPKEYIAALEGLPEAIKQKMLAIAEHRQALTKLEERLAVEEVPLRMECAAEGKNEEARKSIFLQRAAENTALTVLREQIAAKELLTKQLEADEKCLCEQARNKRVILEAVGRILKGD